MVALPKWLLRTSGSRCFTDTWVNGLSRGDDGLCIQALVGNLNAPACKVDRQRCCPAICCEPRWGKTHGGLRAVLREAKSRRG